SRRHGQLAPAATEQPRRLLLSAVAGVHLGDVGFDGQRSACSAHERRHTVTERRHLRKLALLIIAVFLPPLPATARSAGAASYAAAPCPNPIVKGIPQLDLGPEIQCGYLTVPENRNIADGRTLRLLVAHIKATSPTPKPDPIVLLAGGPGGSA